MLNKQDIIAIYDLIGRADIKGAEAEAIVSLKQKLVSIIKSNPEATPVATEEKKNEESK